MSDFTLGLTPEEIEQLVAASGGQGNLPGNTGGSAPIPGITSSANAPDVPTFDPNDSTTYGAGASNNGPPDEPANGSNTPVVPNTVVNPVDANHAQIQNPTLPNGTKFEYTNEEAGSNLMMDPNAYQLGNTPNVKTTTGKAATAQAVQPQAAIGYEAYTGGAAPDVTAEQGTMSSNAQVKAEQQNGLSPELEKTFKDFNAELDAIGLGAEETTAGQFTKLMSGWDENGGVPLWAQGAYRKAQEEMAKRGIAASTISGDAIASALVQAAMPIASQDAAAWQTLKLSKLDKKAQGVFLRAGFISQLDMTNLNNRQQAAVVNAQNFLALDMKNLDNRQQAAIINTQSRLQKMLGDNAAINSARQFNANSQNQVNQFYADLGARIDTFNTAQKNSMETFNVAENNAMKKFNTELANDREKFNTNSRFQIDQANTNYLRGINTRNTAGINQANYVNSQSLLQISNTAMANEIQIWRDSVSFLHESSENALDRAHQAATLGMQNENWFQRYNAQQKDNTIAAIGGFAAGVFNTWFEDYLEDDAGGSDDEDEGPIWT